jgi:hypothetical protein
MLCARAEVNQLLWLYLLVPPVETGEVTRIPRLAESRGSNSTVWANFPGHGAQVVPKIDDRWPIREPVPVVNAVDHEPRLEHERMRDHRVMFGVGVLLDIKVPLDRSHRTPYS